MVLTRLGHAAEQPPPRKDTVKSRQRMMVVVMTVVGGLGLHVEVYCRVQGPVQTKLTTLRYAELARVTRSRSDHMAHIPRAGPPRTQTHTLQLPSDQSVALANHLNVMNKLLLIRPIVHNILKCNQPLDAITTPLHPQTASSIYSTCMLISFVTMISMTSIPSVGSLSGIQLSMLNACSTGEVGHDSGPIGQHARDESDIPWTTFEVEPRARSRRISSEYIIGRDADGLVGEGGGFDGCRRGLVGQDIGQLSGGRPSKREQGGLRGPASKPTGLWQVLFQKRGLVGLIFGLTGGDIGDGLPGREKILSEPSS